MFKYKVMHQRLSTNEQRRENRNNGWEKRERKNVTKEEKWYHTIHLKHTAVNFKCQSCLFET